MLVQLLMLFILLGGGIFCAVFFDRKIEEAIPVQMMAMSLVLYLFGLADHLRTGVYFVAAAIMIIFVISVVATVYKIRKKDFSIWKKILTPAFFVYLFIFLIFTYSDVGMMAHSWDEFTHWIDSIKAMTYIDDLCTNPAAFSHFPSYPPAMTLVQYFFQRIYLMINKEGLFNEWRMYFVFQMFGISQLLPFLKNEEFKKPFKLILHTVLILFIPLFFYNHYWSATYIDPFIGILAGCGFSKVLFCDENDFWDCLHLSLLCATLILSKDVGLYFAIFIAATYVIKYIGTSVVMPKDANISMRRRVLGLVQCFLPACAVLFSKLSWKHELVTSATKIKFGGKIDILYYTEMFFLKNDDTYHQKVVDKFKKAFFKKNIIIENFDFPVTYIVLFLLSLAGIILLWYFISRKVEEKKKPWKIFTLGIILFMHIFYIYSLGATYVSNFSESEALRLASYNRYINISFLAVAILIIEGFFIYSKTCKKNFVAAQMLILLMVLMIMPLKSVRAFVCRDVITEAREMRNKYEPLHRLIIKYCSGTDEDKIYFISEEDKGIDYFVTKFISRPNAFAPGSRLWSLGEPQYKGDIWTNKRIKNSDEWMEFLNNGGYTHIALYYVNDYFKENYSGVFSNPKEVANNRLYVKNSKTGLFDLCK